MTIQELHNKLNEYGIPDDYYYLHGLFGSTNDSNKMSLSVKKGKFNLEYEIYYEERGEKQIHAIFYKEEEACTYLFDELFENWNLEQISKIEGLGGMTVNERLYVSGLMNLYDKSLVNDMVKAKQILRWLRVDEASIKQIIDSLE